MIINPLEERSDAMNTHDVSSSVCHRAEDPDTGATAEHRADINIISIVPSSDDHTWPLRGMERNRAESF